jgi:membrane protein YdbS with pleckstrin-like domain
VTVFTIWPDDVVWRRVSPRLFVIHLVGYLATVVALVLACLILSYALNRPQVWTIGAILNLASLARLALVPRSIRSWGYAERADDLLVRHGLLYRRLSIVPYGRMQFVDVTAGPLERLLGLSTVQLHTAAAASDARIPGLTAAEAARLRDRLSALGEARAEGL